MQVPVYSDVEKRTFRGQDALQRLRGQIFAVLEEASQQQQDSGRLGRRVWQEQD